MEAKFDTPTNNQKQVKVIVGTQKVKKVATGS
jgi:hypothetical protein